jgi:molybdate transport system substrate-binding protein
LTKKIKVLAAGACRNAVVSITEAFSKSSGIGIDIDFATAPVTREKIGRGDGKFDALITAESITEEYLKSGIINADPIIPLGAIASCVVVRGGVPHPDISTVETFCDALGTASAVIFNVASSGIYIESLIEKLGLKEEIADRAERAPTGSAVMERIASGAGDKEIGFGQMTEILRVKATGMNIDLVGPLPSEIANMTTFIASTLATTQLPDEASTLVEFIATSEAKKLIHEAGLS